MSPLLQMKGMPVILKVDDIDINYTEAGSGKTLVLVMGFTGTIESWVPSFVEPGAAGSRVIMFDNRGTGGTTEGTGALRIEQFALDTAGFVEACPRTRRSWRKRFPAARLSSLKGAATASSFRNPTKARASYRSFLQANEIRPLRSEPGESVTWPTDRESCGPEFSRNSIGL